MDISSLTNSNKYSQLSTVLNSHAANIDINGVSIPVKDSKTMTDKLYPAALTGDTPTAEIFDYYAPSKIALDTYQKLGIDIDKSLKSAFLLQTFNIKGTEILCSTFCFILSLMSCSARNALYESIQAINQGIAIANTAVRAYNTAIETFNAAANAANTVAGTVSDIFSSDGQTTKGQIKDLTTASSVLMATPSSVIGIIDKLKGVMKYSKNLKYSISDFSGCRVWKISDNILFQMQAMFISVLDEILNTLFKPVEDLINGFTVQPCFNNMADAIRKKILVTITSLKSRMKAEIADIFASDSDFEKKFRDKHKNMGEALELSAFLDALTIIGSNFQAVAMGCGLSPCTNSNTNSPTTSGNTTDDINPFSFDVTGSPTYGSSSTKNETNYSDINDISNAFKDFLSPDSVNIDNNTISSIYKIAKDAPSQIKDFINDGVLNYILDSNYNINPDTATITYKFNRSCG